MLSLYCDKYKSRFLKPIPMPCSNYMNSKQTAKETSYELVMNQPHSYFPHHPLLSNSRPSWRSM